MEGVIENCRGYLYEAQEAWKLKKNIVSYRSQLTIYDGMTEVQTLDKAECIKNNKHVARHFSERLLDPNEHF